MKNFTVFFVVIFCELTGKKTDMCKLKGTKRTDSKFENDDTLRISMDSNGVSVQPMMG